MDALGEPSRWRWSDLRRIELFPNSRLGDPQIEIPELWLPRARYRMLSYRRLWPCMRRDLPPDAVTVEDTDPVRDETVRRCMLALRLGKDTLQGTRTSELTSWKDDCDRLLNMVKWSFVHKRAEGKVFAHLDHDDLRRMLQEVTTSNEARLRFLRILEYLADAGRRGMLIDFPSLDVPLDDEAGQHERKRFGVQVPKAKSKQTDRTWQPFHDDFVAGVMRNAMWVQQNLADQVLDCWGRCRNVALHAPKSEEAGITLVTRKKQMEELRAFTWSDANGYPIVKLAFPVLYGRVKTDEWPPKNLHRLNRWVGLVQALNLQVLAFCTGARRSEIGSATDTSIVVKPEGLASFAGMTFKTVGDGGKAREWPIHPVAVRALQIQIKLAELVRGNEGDHLWVKVGKPDAAGGKEQNYEITAAAIAGIAMMDMEELAAKGMTGTADDRNAHLHRWRHTIARLISLTVTEAPQTVMDLFGHRNMQVSIRYMLSNPEIMRDAKRVAAESKIAMASTVIESALSGEASGPAAEAIKRGLPTLLQEGNAYRTGMDAEAEHVAPDLQHGSKRFKVSTLREAALLLTAGGLEWNLVRPGVICTKTADQAGPCTQGWGAPDVGACRTTCAHRIETPDAKEKCRETLVALLTEHAAAQAAGQSMLVRNYEGQILANLHRWDDVRKEMLERHAVAKAIWEKAA